MIQYDPHHWLDHFFDFRGSLVKEISGRVLLCVLWAGAVVWVDQKIVNVGIPSLLHTLLGTAMGLLLVFRTNSSYDRFWEGRRLWGGMVNECRNLVRASLVQFGEERDLMVRLTRWTALFPVAAKNGLRGADGLGPLAAGLPAAELAAADAAQHTALAIATEMTRCLREARDRGRISDYVMMTLDQNVQLLIDYLGGCERIRKTPMPFAYAVHLRRALVLYCLTLPFAMVDQFGWVTVLDVAFLSYVFFGIEEIGVEIEGPFGHDDNDLPLEDICETIHGNVYALAGIEKIDRERLPAG